MKLPDSFRPFVALARADGVRYVSPFRLGIYVALAGEDLPSPYPAGARGETSYLQGIEEGKRRRLKSTQEQIEAIRSAVALEKAAL